MTAPTFQDYLDVLAPYIGERGFGETPMQCLERIIRERNEARLVAGFGEKDTDYVPANPKPGAFTTRDIATSARTQTHAEPAAPSLRTPAQRLSDGLTTDDDGIPGAPKAADVAPERPPADDDSDIDIR